VRAENIPSTHSLFKLQSVALIVLLQLAASIFDGRISTQNIADHWVVLSSPIIIDGKPMLLLLAKGKPINNDKSILSKKISFNVYCWGNSARAVNLRISGLTVAQFLHHFYGYMSAK